MAENDKKVSHASHVKPVSHASWVGREQVKNDRESTFFFEELGNEILMFFVTLK